MTNPLLIIWFLNFDKDIGARTYHMYEESLEKRSETREINLFLIEKTQASVTNNFWCFSLLSYKKVYTIPQVIYQLKYVLTLYYEPVLQNDRHDI